MKLSEWAKRQGIMYKTAWNWFHAGILPVPARQLPTGTILVDEATPEPGHVAIYARVSSHDQKADLDRQVSRLVSFALEHDLSVSRVVTEIGSGLNGKRPKLMALLRDKSVSTILVEHRERLMRFGMEYVESAFTACGRQIIVADQSEMTDDLVRDMIEVMVSFCARLYGRRSARNKAKKALDVLQS
jgi:predicted site-specific integrase-resolvase